MRGTKRSTLLVVALALVLFHAGVASAQWSIGPAWSSDAIVVGTLLNLDRSVVRHRGVSYDQLVGTLAVERVVYCEQGAEIPTVAQVFVAQKVALLCPRVAIEHCVGRRGLWCLDRSSVEGVYTVYQGMPFREEIEPGPYVGMSLSATVADRASGEVELAVRYDNYSSRVSEFVELTTDADRRPLSAPDLVLAARPGIWEKGKKVEGAATLLETSALPAARFTLPPWSSRRATVRVRLPATLRNLDWIDIGLAEKGKFRWLCSVWTSPPHTDEPPIFLAPDAETTPIFPPAGASRILFVAALGTLALAIGLHPRIASRTDWLRLAGATTCAAALAALPWGWCGFDLIDLIKAWPYSLVGLVWDACVLGILAFALRRDTRRSTTLLVTALAPVIVLVGPTLVGKLAS